MTARPARRGRLRRASELVAIAMITAFATGCGGGQKPTNDTEVGDFKCRDRRVAYIATGHFAGPEVRVVVDCAERGPRIKRRVALDDKGGEQTGEHSLSVAQFNDLWEKIESTGWRNLDDCDNPSASEGDPAYKFGIKDENGAASLACAGKELPFPFDRLLNELDLLVAEHGL